MSTSSILAANAAATQTVFFNRRAPANGAGKDSSTPSTSSISSTSATIQGSSLFKALYEALTQFVQNNEASTAGNDGPTRKSGGDVSSAGGVAVTTGGGTTAAGTTASAGSNGSSSSSLSTDLQNFLTDLFGALRQAGGHGHRHGGGPLPPTTSGTTANANTTTTPAAATTASASTSSTGANNALPVTSVTPVAAAATTTTPTTSAAASTTTSAGSAAAEYGESANQGIINALKALIQDITNSEVVGSTSAASGSPSNLSANAISNLSTAFSKLISDLGGTTASAAGATGTTNSADASAGAGSTSSSSTNDTATAALQSFLSSFLQDLQNNGTAASTSTQGTLINTLA